MIGILDQSSVEVSFFFLNKNKKKVKSSIYQRTNAKHLTYLKRNLFIQSSKWKAYKMLYSHEPGDSNASRSLQKLNKHSGCVNNHSRIYQIEIDVHNSIGTLMDKHMLDIFGNRTLHASVVVCPTRKLYLYVIVMKSNCLIWMLY